MRVSAIAQVEKPQGELPRKHMEGKKKKKEIVVFVSCEHCGATVRVGTNVCPHCQRLRPKFV
jgi:rubrerythrin